MATKSPELGSGSGEFLQTPAYKGVAEMQKLHHSAIYTDAFIATSALVLVFLVVMVTRKSPLLRRTGTSIEVDELEELEAGLGKVE